MTLPKTNTRLHGPRAKDVRHLLGGEPISLWKFTQGREKVQGNKNAMNNRT